MIRSIVLLTLICLMVACESRTVVQHKAKSAPPITLVVHGGAGTIRKGAMTPGQEKAYHAALELALEAGYAVLDGRGKSVDAVITAIALLEDSPLFNAGKGAVFTDEGTHELDASIMDGSTLDAGAVAGVTMVKNPIRAAFAVMTQSEHVMLAGKGADDFALLHGLEMVSPEYFRDPVRYEQFLKGRESKKSGDGAFMEDTSVRKFGTVGAVALDQFGNIAAGTSTGGMSNKRWGRVGDAPIIGAGTYADNNACAVSATGWGEFFIRLSVAHDICALMQYRGLSVQAAADSVIHKKLSRLGGTGGVIALDKHGNISMPFNTEGMYRGFIRKKGEAKTFLYKQDAQ